MCDFFFNLQMSQKSYMATLKKELASWLFTWLYSKSSLCVFFSWLGAFSKWHLQNWLTKIYCNVIRNPNQTHMHTQKMHGRFVAMIIVHKSIWKNMKDKTLIIRVCLWTQCHKHKNYKSKRNFQNIQNPIQTMEKYV